MIVYKPSPGYQFPHFNLADYVADGSNQIPLDFKKNELPPRDYPELPDEAGMGAVLHGEDSYIAVLNPLLIKIR